jgi:hypothetical protein
LIRTTFGHFSVSGRVCTFDRVSLTPANVDILHTLHVWEMSGDDESKRAQLKNTKDNRFCKIQIDEEAGTLIIISVIGPDDFDDCKDDEFEDSSDYITHGLMPPTSHLPPVNPVEVYDLRTRFAISLFFHSFTFAIWLSPVRFTVSL